MIDVGIELIAPQVLDAYSLATGTHALSANTSAAVFVRYCQLWWQPLYGNMRFRIEGAYDTDKWQNIAFWSPARTPSIYFAPVTGTASSKTISLPATPISYYVPRQRVLIIDGEFGSFSATNAEWAEIASLTDTTVELVSPLRYTHSDATIFNRAESWCAQFDTRTYSAIRIVADAAWCQTPIFTSSYLTILDVMV